MRGARRSIAARQPLAGIEHHLRHDDEIDSRADRRDDVVRREPSVGARLDERERDAAAPRVLAQDHVERVELAARRDHARRAVVAC